MTEPALLWQHLFDEARDARRFNQQDHFARGLLLGKGIMLSIYIDDPVRGGEKLRELSSLVFDSRPAQNATDPIPPLAS
jgi:hypothetical protein